jgi:cation diffusion facilitator family transporter
MSTILFNRSNLTKFAWLSIGVAILTIVLKTIAYLITGSVGLLSDALESVVNLVGGLMALAMLTIAARPADEEHAFGHSKAEYFSSGVEGTLILIAAISIAYTAVERLIHPQPLEQIGLGLIVSVGASLANLTVALILKKAGKQYNSISLTSNSHHLMTDVWTSAGVLVGVGAVALTNWQPLDPIVAILVAINIVFTGFGIIRKSISGLMDTSISKEDMDVLDELLKKHLDPNLQIHRLRTRQSGSAKFISFHLLVPGDWSVDRGHKLATKIENELADKIPDSTIFTHVEALEDPASMDDPNLKAGSKSNKINNTVKLG